MKKTIRTAAILAVLSLVTVGCQKEYVNGSYIVQADNMVCYTINGMPGSTNLEDDKAWDAFMERMLALAKEGYEVTFFRGTSPINSMSKETVVYTTDDKDDAKRWSIEMAKDGYQVTITYNDETGIYTCIAIK